MPTSHSDLSETHHADATVPLLTGSARRLRWLELLLLLGISFGPSLMASVHVQMLYPLQPYVSHRFTASGMQATFLAEMGQIALLIYILFRQGRRLRDIGVNRRGTDIPIALPLYGLAYGLEHLARVVYALAHSYHIQYPSLWQMAMHRFAYDRHMGPAYFISQFCLAIVNPFAEELIVRAYLITEIRALTGNIAVAVAVSTLVQTSYHFYQGVVPPIGYAAAFLVFSLWFAKTTRIMPVIFAHMLLDLLPFY